MRPKLQKSAYLILALAALVPFAHVGALGFTNFDDPGYVTQNVHVQGGITWDGIIWAFTSTEQANWHPLTWLSHMLDCQLFGSNPAGPHAVNLLFHLASTLILFHVLHRMTGALGRSIFVAALFAIHPLRVESVAWVAERKDVLSTFFWMLAMHAYVRSVDSRRWADRLLVGVWLVLGLASKPMLVTLPLALLLLDFWPLRRFTIGVPAAAAPKRGASGARPPTALSFTHPAMMDKLPLFVLVAVSSVITFLVQQKGGAVITWQRLSLDARIANALVSYSTYVRKMFFPFNLAPFYPMPDSIGWGSAAVSVGFLAVLTVVAVRLWRRVPYFAVGWFWYLGTLVPVIGLVQVGNQSMADRYSYIPLIGLFLILSWGGWDLAQGFRIPARALGCAAGIVLLLLGAQTYRQVGYWKSSETLFRHTIEVTGDNPRAYLNLGAALVSENRLAEAVTVYSEFLSRNPDDAELQARLAMILAMQGKNQESIEHYQHALRIEPNHPEANNGLGFALGLLGRWEEAILHHQEALRWKPRFPEARYNLGKAYAALGKPQLAIDQFTEALQLRPDYFEAHERMALVLASQGKLDDALPHFAAAAGVRPDDPEIHFRYGMALYQRNRASEAISQLRTAVTLKPDWPDALDNLAWILATTPDATGEDAAQAVTFAEKARALSRRPEASRYDTLGAAYARAGRFTDAIRAAEEALRMAQMAGDTSLAAEITRRCRLYKSGKSYRFPE